MENEDSVTLFDTKKSIPVAVADLTCIVEEQRSKFCIETPDYNAFYGVKTEIKEL